jgi:hypothetical protein
LLTLIAKVTVDAVHGSYAKARVSQTKNHLEKVYGKGLVGLFNEEGKLTHKALRASRMRPSYNSLALYELGTIDAESV